MGKSNLILFTSSFPYGKGENFIDVELKFLASHFNTIFIFPYHYGGNPECRFVFPENIKVFKPFRDEHHTFIKLLFKGLINFQPFFIYWQDLFIKPTLLINYTQFSLWFRSLLNCRMILQNKRLRQVICQYTGNMIYYFYWGNRPSGIIAGLHKKKDPVIVRFHGTDLYREMEINKGYIPFQKIVVERASQIFCISNHGEQYLRRSYKQIKNKFKLSRLGTIDHGLSVGTPGKVLNIISCSVIDQNKRVLMIARVLKDIGFRVDWTHIGDGPLMQEIKSELENQGSNNLRAILPGKLSNEKVHELYKTQYFDLFINLSASEGVPFSIMEALSYSIPVLATAVGGVPEIIDESCGKLVDKNLDLELLRSFITYFNGLSLSERNIFRNNSRRRWEELCNAEKNYKDFIICLENL